MRDSEVLDVVDQENSTFREPLEGAYAVSIRLKDGSDYKNYTVKVKGTSKEFEFVEGEGDKFFFLENSDGNVPDEITVIVSKKGTNEIQKFTIKKEKVEI